MVSRIVVSEKAKATIEQLRNGYGLLKFQAGGLGEDTSLICFESTQFQPGISVLLLGEIHGCEFYIPESQFKYWKHLQLFVEVIPNEGPGQSLEIPLGLRFVIRSRMFPTNDLPAIFPEKRFMN